MMENKVPHKEEIVQWIEKPTCPKCEGPLPRHSFQVKDKGQIISIMNTYHCAQDGDVVPVIKVG